jgi:hypothetical protein
MRVGNFIFKTQRGDKVIFTLEEAWTEDATVIVDGTLFFI